MLVGKVGRKWGMRTLSDMARMHILQVGSAYGEVLANGLPIDSDHDDREGLGGCSRRVDGDVGTSGCGIARTQVGPAYQTAVLRHLACNGPNNPSFSDEECWNLHAFCSLARNFVVSFNKVRCISA